jgi:cyclase
MSGTIAEIAEGVWLGVPGPIPHEGSMAAVVSDGQMLVIDSTSYNVFADRFVREVADATGADGPTLLYITHRHFDHFGGADAVKAPVIGHRLTREMMARYTQDWLQNNIAAWTDAGMVVPELISEPKLVLPQIVFDDRLVVHVGSTPVELIHVGGHCADQTVVYLPKQRVFFGSDNLFNGKPPYTGDGDLATWIASLRWARTLDIDIAVPGHGTTGGPEIIDAQVAELEGLFETWLRGES